MRVFSCVQQFLSLLIAQRLISMPHSSNDSRFLPGPHAPLIGMPVVVPLRDLVDSALNTVIERAAAEARLAAGTLGRCGDYALVGARVLSVLLDRPYVAVAGGEIIDCGGGRYIVLFPSRKARRHARKLSDLKDYHCWIQAEHGLPQGGTRLEQVDFTVRHNRQVAGVFRVPYLAADQDYLWEWQDVIVPVPAEVRLQLSANGNGGDWMWCDAVCMRLLHKYAQEHETLLQQLTADVLNQLADMIDARSAPGTLLCGKLRTVRQVADSAIGRLASRPA